MNKSVILATALAGALSSVAIADHLFWIGTNSGTDNNWKSYGEKNNWCIGDNWTSETQGTRIPLATDLIHMGNDYKAYFWFDLGGADYTAGGIYNGDGAWGQRYIYLRNGSLTLDGDVTHTYWYVNVMNGGTLTLSENSSGRFGRQAQPGYFFVNDGGRMEWFGDVSFAASHTCVYEGGAFTLAPKSLTVASTFCTANGRGASISNWGNLDVPNGFAFTGNGASKGYLTISQIAGTLTLGGPITHSSNNSYLRFELSGGTLKATGDASVTSSTAPGRIELVMTNDVVATVEVEDGRLLDLANLVCGERTALTKTGAGSLRLGPKGPATLDVAEGMLDVSGAVQVGAFTLGAGATLKVRTGGLACDAATVDADAQVAVDAATLKDNDVVFSSPDAAVNAAMLAKFQAIDGLTGRFRLNNTSIVYEIAHDPILFSWKSEGTAYSIDNMTYSYYSFCDPKSWVIGNSPSGTNPDERIPGAGDDIYISNTWGPVFAFDMGGQYRTVRNYDKTGYTERWGFNPFFIRNGTLEFAGEFFSTRGVLIPEAGGTFVLGPDSTSKFGNGDAQFYGFIRQDGVAKIGGSVDIAILLMKVEEGGTLTFDPKSCVFDANSFHGGHGASFIENHGTLNLPNGFVVSGGGRSDYWGKMELRLLEGSAVLGGPVQKMSAASGNLSFILGGGTLQVTDDVSFSGLYRTLMQENAVVTADVASGKTLDLTAMTFETGTKIVKTGAGTIRFGANRPSAFDLQGGTVEYAQKAELGDSLTVGAGTSIVFDAYGNSAGSVPGLEGATVTCTVASGSGIILLSPDAGKLSDVRCAAGVVTLSGGAAICEVPHDETVFSWKKMLNPPTVPSGAKWRLGPDEVPGLTHYLFFDAANWAIGRNPSNANPDGLVPSAADSLYIDKGYEPLILANMCGQERLLADYDKEGYTETWGFNGFSIMNGTFGFTGTFNSTRPVIFAHHGGRFVFGDDATVTLANGGAEGKSYVYDGGEVVFGGDLTIVAYQADVRAGGRHVLRPKGNLITWKPNSGSSPSTYFNVAGTLELPVDVAIKSTRSDNSFTFNLMDGATLDLGGKLSVTSGNCLFNLGSGTVNATNRTAITGFTSCSMAEGATVTVNVPKGSSLNLSEMTFGADTTIEKYGSGRLIFGASRPTNYIRHDPIPGLLLLVR